MKRSVLRQMIAVVSRPGILSFAGGLPSPALFPTQAYGAALSEVLQEDSRALQYGPPFAPLIAQIVRLMARRGVDVAPEQIFITTGAQQALDVLAKLLVDPGGSVLLEERSYTGMLQALASRQPRLLPVPTDLATGINVDTVARYLASGERPAFLYVIPEAHNPLGVSIGVDKRVRLVELAREYGVPIVEDDPYGLLSYDGEAPSPLRALDADWVFYVGSFSKILAPALRLGWIVAPPALIPQLTVVKEAVDLETSALTQRAVGHFLEQGQLPAHLERLRAAYGSRRDAMLAALKASFPPEAVWTIPSAGMFIWVELPAQVDCQALLERAVAEEQVAFIPGHAFALPGCSAGAAMRLNFSNATEAEIADGIARLGRVLNDIV
jgi:2-aminoadipate transaminase